MTQQKQKFPLYCPEVSGQTLLIWGQFSRLFWPERIFVNVLLLLQ